MPEWKDEYPWLQLAFRQSGPSGKIASEEWRWRIEEDLKAPLDYQAHGDGTATVWCGLTRHDFPHGPTPRDLLQGLDTAYREELGRRGWEYPDLHASPSQAQEEPVTIATHYGDVKISPAARKSLLEELRQRGTDDLFVRIFQGMPASRPINLDREGKIVVFDALWALAESAGGYDLIDPDLRELQHKLKDEITEGRI